jgi:flavin reductase (DIM6/NTAB) family NADH-FMN oxidoreductase RutF
MFYDATKLPKGLFKACIVPRPIAWVSSVSEQGVFNLAPFSYFNAIADQPPLVMFSTTNTHIEGGAKDSLLNIEATKEFVINMATYDMREAVNLSSADLPRQENEFDFANIEYEPSEIVHVPRVKASPIHLECIYYTSVQLPTEGAETINRMVIGKVVGIHIREEILTDGKVDIAKLQPIARLGYNDYAKISTDIFSMIRPQITKKE